MKNSINIFNALNESLEAEFEAKRKSKLNESAEDQYMLLDRLRSDCEYYLGNGNRNPKHLWAGNEQGQIAEMRKIYNQLPEKPDWISEEDIDRYEREMIGIDKDLTRGPESEETIKGMLRRARKDVGLDTSDLDESDKMEEIVEEVVEEIVNESKDWTPEEIQKASEVMKKKGHLGYEEFTKEWDKKSKKNEGEIVTIHNTQPEPDYVISDVTVLDTIDNGDVQSPDIDALLTLIDESLKSEYSNEWGRIKTLSSSKNEAYSYALVDISTPEILKEFEEKGIEDAAIGKNLILESLPLGMFKFKVNNLNGITKYSKVTDNPQQAIYEWVESEFLHEAKEEKVKELEILKAKTEKETIENYIENRIDLRQEIENIKMFIELSKQAKASEEMKPAIQKRMYAFAAEMPHNIEITNKDDKYELSFGSLDKTVEIIFGKQWVKEVEEVPEVVELKESYEQFNIGDIEVVFNPETYECLYSIPSAEVKDKKINLTKVPSVDTPYDTNTIIKSYIETRFGVVPSEEEKKMIDQGEVSAPEQDLAPIPTDDIEVPVEIDTELEEDELPEEPTDTEIEMEPEAPVEDEVPTSETGNAIFMKIRPKQSTNIESLRQRTFDGDTPESNYIVVDNIDLNSEDWNDLTSDLTKPQYYLEGIKPIDRKNYSFNVVKVTNAEANFDLLIDPLGYNYPRYIAITDKEV